mmetsp:Transcript_25334/g.28097  ORF Transcript_25334/g.28097 Transcript_25334/m.28097 type:complete len:86 (+) Transcript_25334:237-494(+)
MYKNLEIIEESRGQNAGKNSEKMDINEILALEFTKQKEELISKLSFSGSDKDSDRKSNPDKDDNSSPEFRSKIMRSKTNIGRDKI